MCLTSNRNEKRSTGGELYKHANVFYSSGGDGYPAPGFRRSVPELLLILTTILPALHYGNALTGHGHTLQGPPARNLSCSCSVLVVLLFCVQAKENRELTPAVSAPPPMGNAASAVAAKMAFFPPDPPTYDLSCDDGRPCIPGVGGDRNVDVHVLRTRAGSRVVATFWRHPLARFTVLYSHGNAVDLGTTVGFLAELRIRLRANIVGYDYSGYGASSGKPSETNTYHDIEAVYNLLKRDYAISQEDLILYGQSIGSGPTLHLAAGLTKLRAVVLHSAMLSGLRVLYPTVKRTLWFDIFKNIDKIGRVNCPVLVMHGTADDIVPWSHGKRLWEMSKDKYDPLWIDGGGHCNLESYPDYLRHLQRFLNAMERRAQGKPPRKASATPLQNMTATPIMPTVKHKGCLRF